MIKTYRFRFPWGRGPVLPATTDKEAKAALSAEQDAQSGNLMNRPLAVIKETVEEIA